MKQLIFALITLFSCTLLSAQVTAPTENSDPAAKKVLDKIRKKYEGYKTVEAAFSLTLDVPTKPKDVQKGVIGQEGDKFRLDMDQQTIVSDGKTTWVYLKNNNEVQINNADPAGSDNGFMTPKDLLKRYQKGDFLYALTDKAMENGKLLSQIEFKPKDKSSEYSKFRLSVDEKTSEIKSILAFHKDGSRYTFVITRLNTSKAFNADYFKFDTKKYPGVKVEDLRM
ncbi:MAG: outer membrane lipoprotein carrier protein LolA [Bacteroidota bacterium]